jgi:hypothetical protein
MYFVGGQAPATQALDPYWESLANEACRKSDIFIYLQMYLFVENFAM